MIFFIKSCEIEDEITNNRPAAVDRAAARAPAASNAITQFGNWAISRIGRWWFIKNYSW